MNRQEFELLERITLNPDPKVGKPVIRNTTLLDGTGSAASDEPGYSHCGNRQAASADNRGGCAGLRTVRAENYGGHYLYAPVLDLGQQGQSC